MPAVKDTLKRELQRDWHFDSGGSEPQTPGRRLVKVILVVEVVVLKPFVVPLVFAQPSEHFRSGAADHEVEPLGAAAVLQHADDPAAPFGAVVGAGDEQRFAFGAKLEFHARLLRIDVAEDRLQAVVVGVRLEAQMPGIGDGAFDQLADVGRRVIFHFELLVQLLAQGVILGSDAQPSKAVLDPQAVAVDEEHRDGNAVFRQAAADNDVPHAIFP